MAAAAAFTVSMAAADAALTVSMAAADAASTVSMLLCTGTISSPLSMIVEAKDQGTHEIP